MSDDILLLLDAPEISPEDIRQYLAVCMTSIARIGRSKEQLPVISTGGGSHGHATATSDSNKRDLLQAFDDDAIASQANDRDRRIKLDRNIPYLEQSLATPRHKGRPQIPMNSRFHSLAARVPVVDASDIRMTTWQRAILKTEANSLVPTEASGEYGMLYTLTLRMSSDSTMHCDLTPYKNTKYRLAIDTGDSAFWFYGSDFEELIEVNGLYEEVPWANGTPGHKSKNRHPTIPLGVKECALDSAHYRYVDGGALHIYRWEDAVPFTAPGWDWKKNASCKSSITLKFPRVLATAASRVAVKQPVDGNLGLAITGSRYPWDRRREAQHGLVPSSVTKKDRLTFFDIVSNCSAGPLIDDPAQLTIRLLIPNEERENHTVERQRRSFLYYGHGEPCGILGADEKLLLPVYTPKLEVWPSYEYVSRTSITFDMWRLRLISLTLMTPTEENPDYADYDSIDDGWDHECISMPSTPDPLTKTSPGIPVLFDTGAGCSVLPKAIVQRIWEEWFENEPNKFPEYRSRSKLPPPIWHKREDKFAHHDLLFTFMDHTGETYTHRCGAEHVLTSPWDLPDGAHCSLLTYHGKEQPGTEYILGMNFFWANLVRTNTEGDNAPTIQFAAQRVVQHGRKIGEAWDLGIHAHLPPRIQALRTSFTCPLQ
ncbi:hypothetical protein C8Q80DRAFT_1147418 [Daedaleopsis nitida]|nr:hypothetical protein C8Q80DRAFT_1147418 [Daedaleopsis nitida]